MSDFGVANTLRNCYVFAILKTNGTNKHAMTDERLRYIRNLNSLVPVTDHTRLIYLDENEQVRIRDKLPAPVDENGIPRPEIMVQRIYENMTTENYVWTGVFDEHHTATPKADYTVVRSASDGNIGSVFRGLSFRYHAKCTIFRTLCLSYHDDPTQA